MTKNFEAGYNLYTGVIKKIDIENKIIEASEGHELVEELHLDFYQHETKLSASVALALEAKAADRLAMLHAQRATSLNLMLGDIEKMIDSPLIQLRDKLVAEILDRKR